MAESLLSQNLCLRYIDDIVIPRNDINNILNQLIWEIYIRRSKVSQTCKVFQTEEGGKFFVLLIIEKN